MITKFKLFESLNEGELEVGDYVLHRSRRGEGLYDILAISIGKVINIRKVYNEVEVEYDRPIGRMFIDLDRIEYWSKDKEDLEALLATKKYNL